MKIADGMAVTMAYVLKDDNGEVIDSSEGDEPLEYLHGAGEIVPGLEKAMGGKAVGDKVEVKVGPEEGYGKHHAEGIQEVPKSAFEGVNDIKAGMRFRAEGPEGSSLIQVVEVKDDSVVIDANHPLAGKTLHFAIEVLAIREATDDEKAHGHVHGPDGHEH
jgi:FKBP-type peptidyl-prolyl cis-trans isomerase SlyD